MAGVSEEADLGLDIRRHPDFSQELEGPFIITFTAHLPFPIGIPNELGHGISLAQPFVDDEYRATYRWPFVRIRVFDQLQSGLPVWSTGTHEAIKHFFGSDLEGDAAARYGEEHFVEHNQWVTLETPWGAVEGSDTDPFHRCLWLFNSFLQATLLITRDIRIRTVASHDLRPVVIIGAIAHQQKWQYLSSMHMHPEAIPEPVLTVKKPFGEDDLNGALFALATQKPYVLTMLWRARAQRALRQTGDGADAVISFQIAAESLLFETYRMLLVDEGVHSDDISAELAKDAPFKRFFTHTLPSRLGGDWHIDHPTTPVGNYWKDLYLVRNSILHAGMVAHTGHAETAQKAYWGLRDHLETRLWARHKMYPRTLYARLGKDQLQAKGWLTAWMRDFIEQVEAETGVWYWPYDLANRPRI